MREAGDLEDEQGNPIPPTDEMATLAYRAGLSPKKPPTRFSASEALMRAFAFSMISPKDDGRQDVLRLLQFKAPSSCQGTKVGPKRIAMNLPIGP